MICEPKIILKNKILMPGLVKSESLGGGPQVSVFLICQVISKVQPKLRTTVLERENFKVSTSHLGLLLERIP